MPGAMLFLRGAPTYGATRAVRPPLFVQGSQSNHDHAADLSVHPHHRRGAGAVRGARRRAGAGAPGASYRARRCSTPIRRSCTEGDARRSSTSTSARACARSVSPFANDPFFQRFFGGRRRLRPAAGAHPVLARLRRHHQCRRRHRHQHACGQGRHRHADPRGAVRQARVRRAHRRPGRAHRPRRAQDREGRQRLSVPAVRRQRQARGRRRGARHRQPVRRRPDGDQRHHLGAWRAPRWRRPRRRCSCRRTRPSIPGNSGGALGRHERQARRHQHDDLLAVGRLGRHRLRHPLEPGAPVRRQRRQPGARSSGRGSAASSRP